ncbi:MAG: hypothetical protein ACOVN3_07565 [Limnohabitans sp.]
MAALKPKRTLKGAGANVVFLAPASTRPVRLMSLAKPKVVGVPESWVSEKLRL